MWRLNFSSHVFTFIVRLRTTTMSGLHSIFHGSSYIYFRLSCVIVHWDMHYKWFQEYLMRKTAFSGKLHARNYDWCKNLRFSVMHRFFVSFLNQALQFKKWEKLIRECWFYGLCIRNSDSVFVVIIQLYRKCGSIFFVYLVI